MGDVLPPKKGWQLHALVAKATCLLVLLHVSASMGMSPTARTLEEVTQQQQLHAALQQNITHGARWDSQCQALLDVGAALAPQGQDVLLLWGSDSHACGDIRNNNKSWPGVTCDRVSGNVIALDLSSKGLTGQLSPAVAQLPALQRISLANNSLTGPLLGEWGNLTYLQDIDLSQNQLTGTLPSAWSFLGALQQLDLSHNQLNGSIPVTWSALTMLEVMDLSFNSLSSTLPESWGRLAFLSVLNLRHNNLTGSLPAGWAKQDALLQLSLADNAITGPIPAEWAAGMSSLRAANLSNNSLAGSLPDTWSNMTNLQTLSAAANMLTGKIPATWSRMAGLYALNISYNQDLCGGVPTSVGSALKGTVQPSINDSCTWENDARMLLSFKSALASYLQGGALDSWQPNSNPCGNPPWDGVGCQNGWVVSVSLPSQQLVGEGLLQLLRLSQLEGLNVSDNKLTGTWPDILSAGPTAPLRVLDLANNQFVGSLPDAWPPVLPSLYLLDMSFNQLINNVPSDLSALPDFSVLLLQGNRLNGTLPATLVSTAPNLTRLDLGHNPGLDGTLPAAWGQSSILQHLGLQRASFTGNVPFSWSSMVRLKYLDISDNHAMCGLLPAFPLSLLLNIEGTMLGRACSGAMQLTSDMIGIIVGVSVAGTCLLCLAAYAIYRAAVARQMAKDEQQHRLLTAAASGLQHRPPASTPQADLQSPSAAPASPSAGSLMGCPGTTAAVCTPVAMPPVGQTNPLGSPSRQHLLGAADSDSSPHAGSPTEVPPRVAVLRQEPRPMSPLGPAASPRSMPHLAFAAEQQVAAANTDAADVPAVPS